MTLLSNRPAISIVMPCFGRPARTARAIAGIKAQTMDNFQAFVIGDCCPKFKPVEDDHRFLSFNGSINHGGFGFHWVNYAIAYATGTYFMFTANDDLLLPNHFEDRYNEMRRNPKLDFMYFNESVEGDLRKTKLKLGHVGDSSLIIRTDFLKKMPARGPEHGHDWKLICDMRKAGAKYRKAKSKKATYIICSGNWNRSHEVID